MGAKADEFKRWGDPRRVAFLFGNARAQEGISSKNKEPFANSRDCGRGMEKRMKKRECYQAVVNPRFVFCM
jgi:hypothetical protein